MKDSLRRYGYRVSVAIDEEDALDRVSNTLSPNLVLIDVVGKSVEDTCRREGAFVNGKDLEGTDENVGGNDWIFYLGEEPEQLQNLLHRLTAKYNDF